MNFSKVLCLLLGIGDIDLWFKKYGFSEEVMIALFRYCFNKSALHRNYIATVAEAWNKNNIKTFNDLDAYYQKEEQVTSLGNSIKKKLRLSRNLTDYEEAYVEKWKITYGYDSFEYIDKLLTDWHEKGFKDSSKIETYLANQKNKPVQKKTENNKTSNFTPRKYNNLDSFYFNVDKK